MDSMGPALLGGAGRDERNKNLRRRIESSHGQGGASVCLGRERETGAWNQCQGTTCGRLRARRPGRDRRRDRARRR